MPEELSDFKIHAMKKWGQGLLRSIGGCIILNLRNLLLVDSELKQILFPLRVVPITCSATIAQ